MLLHCIPLSNCTSPFKLHPSTPLHYTHYTSTALLHCTSLHPQYSTALHCSVQCSTTHITCTACHCTLLDGAMKYSALYFTALHQHCTSLHGAVLHTALDFNALRFTTLYKHCTTLHFTARCCVVHCISLEPH